MISALLQGQSVSNFSLHNGLLKSKGKLVVGPEKDLKIAILDWLQNSSHGVTLECHLKEVQKHLFYWRGMTKFVIHLLDIALLVKLANMRLSLPLDCCNSYPYLRKYGWTYPWTLSQDYHFPLVNLLYL